MNKFNIFILILLVTFGVASPSEAEESTTQSSEQQYLWKPTGEFNVGLQDFHWVTQNCPDFNYNGNNPEDFSSDNIAYCHEITARVYYPTKDHDLPYTPYYAPLISWHLEQFLAQYSLPQDQLDQVKALEGFSIEQASFIQNQSFPVLLFSPGFGCPPELYENFITELVSHGYIVVGIATPFINLTTLPNGHVVQPTDPSTLTPEKVETQFLPLQVQDLLYVYNKLYTLHSEQPFINMDLAHIGIFGHSIGGMTVAKAVRAYPEHFQAAVTLDIGYDSTNQAFKAFPIPLLHQISAERKLLDGTVFELGEQNYLVGITPSENDHDYTVHMSFSDMSTLRYLPTSQIMDEHQEKLVKAGFDLKFYTHIPTEQEYSQFEKMTYIPIKLQNDWTLLQLYERGQKTMDIDLVDLPSENTLYGIKPALEALPESLDQTTPADLVSLKHILTLIQRAYANLPGTGDGWEVTQSMNINMLQFFNTYLKGSANPAFTTCTPLSKNTYLRCGPGKG